MSTAIARRLSFAQKTEKTLQHHLKGSAAQMDSMSTLREAALRLSEEIHQVVSPFDDVLKRTRESSKGDTADNIDTCRDMTKLQQHLEKVLHAVKVHEAKSESAVCTDSHRTVPDESNVLVTFLQSIPAANLAMQATNAQHSLLHDKEVEYNTAVRTACVMEEKCFQLLVVDAVQELEAALDNAQKLEKDVSVLPAFT